MPESAPLQSVAAASAQSLQLANSGAWVAMRPITAADDRELARLLRAVLREHGLDRAGFAFVDPELDSMSAAYTAPNARYLVAEVVDGSAGAPARGTLVAGGGVAPLAGGPQGVCELQKLYLAAEVRGQGLGQAMLDRCLAAAKTLGFHACYLESAGHLTAAQRLFKRNGFEALPEPLGSTGHGACDRFYLRPL